ncbi:cache domain-containing protein [Candidatus Pacearchaeota archaeon]|nr:cache domain-containing protein [Candidatus Pacearchaeota archaeon]
MKKIFILFVGIFLIFSSWAVMGLYSNYSGNGALETQVLGHLESVAFSKAGRIGSFLDERKNDLEFLVSLSDVQSIFDDDFTLTSDIDDKLTFFQETNGYLDLILIGIDGEVLWSASRDDIVGTNLSTDEYSKTKLGEVYEKVKNDFGVGIFDPGYFDVDEQLSVFVTTPILRDSKTVEGKRDMLGIIALQIDNSEIERRVISDVGLGEAGNIYLVNRDKIPIVKLIDVKGKQITELKTQIEKDCFNDYHNYYFKRQGQQVEEVEKSGTYENYKGDKIFGAHQYILRTGWCVIVEMEQNKFYDSLKESKK